MSYVDSNLTKNETVIKKAVLHWFIYMGGIVTIIFAFLFSGSPESEVIVGFLVLLGIALLINAFVISKTTELVVTNKRVIAKHGFISRQTIEINLNKVEGLNVNQGIMGRVFNFGDVIVGGTGGKKSPIKYIKAPLEFRKIVNEQIEG